ncbi:gp98 [Sphingomonas phage PAU]|uniref:gp98 n=1 Tax=Sphingomonas phage PAU TaxID=1150991 RepID=UPI0002573255|nr:gp98 [Sphingomonas phage PAU]AFF28096.1 gp98 [Sphingomonas phage PAU]
MSRERIPFGAQLEVTVAAPPIYGSQVANMSELTTIAAKNAYLHKVVWVISEKGYYYLSAGNGTNLNQWLPVSIGGILEYQNKVYQKGEGVIQNSKVYIALDNIGLGEDPVNAPTKWLSISDVRFNKQSFTNVTEVTVTTPYDNPSVHVYDENDNEVSAFVNVSNGIVKLDLFPALTGYVIVKE